MEPNSIPTMSQEQAYALCKRPEDQFFDRKSALSKAKTAQKIAVAFANAEGGKLRSASKMTKKK
jgi:predicted HTH transcriptional regulator